MDEIPIDDPPELRSPSVWVDDAEALGYFLEGVEEDQYDLNRRTAWRAERLGDALGYARAHPLIYAFGTDAESVALAVRCAVLDAATRLRLSEAMVRSIAAVADAARVSLPLLWRTAREGFACWREVEDAVGLLHHFDGRPDELRTFDDALADLTVATAPASFRKKARLLARKLAPLPEAELHAVAFGQRRVVCEDAGNGMSWLSPLMATADAVTITRNLTANAKHLAKKNRDGRTRDQVRADLAVERLRGTGGREGATAIKTKAFVTVPLSELTDDAQGECPGGWTAAGRGGPEPGAAAGRHRTGRRGHRPASAGRRGTVHPGGHRPGHRGDLGHRPSLPHRDPRAAGMADPASRHLQP